MFNNTFIKIKDWFFFNITLRIKKVEKCKGKKDKWFYELLKKFFEDFK